MEGCDTSSTLGKLCPHPRAQSAAGQGDWPHGAHMQHTLTLTLGEGCSLRTT